MKSWYLLLLCLHLRSAKLTKINQNYHFYWKWPEIFWGQGFLPWVGRVTGNDNIILSRLMTILLQISEHFGQKWKLAVRQIEHLDVYVTPPVNIMAFSLTLTNVTLISIITCETVKWDVKSRLLPGDLDLWPWPSGSTRVSLWNKIFQVILLLSTKVDPWPE